MCCIEVFQCGYGDWGFEIEIFGQFGCIVVVCVVDDDDFVVQFVVLCGECCMIDVVQCFGKLGGFVFCGYYDVDVDYGDILCCGLRMKKFLCIVRFGQDFDWSEIFMRLQCVKRFFKLFC